MTRVFTKRNNNEKTYSLSGNFIFISKGVDHFLYYTDLIIFRSQWSHSYPGSRQYNVIVSTT